MNELVTTDLETISLLGIGGSTRAASSNGAVLREALEYAQTLDVRTGIVDLHVAEFPLLNRDRPLVDYPQDVANYLQAVRDADGFVLCSPTYHGSMSGAFKNALDLLVYGSNAYFDGKPVGLAVLGGANAAPVLDMMATTVHALRGFVVPTRAIVPHGAVHDDGTIVDGDVAARIDRMAAEVVRLAGALRQVDTRTAVRRVA